MQTAGFAQRSGARRELLQIRDLESGGLAKDDGGGSPDFQLLAGTGWDLIDEDDLQAFLEQATGSTERAR